jgi:hypothetical protein
VTQSLGGSCALEPQDIIHSGEGSQADFSTPYHHHNHHQPRPSYMRPTFFQCCPCKRRRPSSCLQLRISTATTLMASNPTQPWIIATPPAH